jgi:hypothetical protein
MTNFETPFGNPLSSHASTDRGTSHGARISCAAAFTPTCFSALSRLPARASVARSAGICAVETIFVAAVFALFERVRGTH